MDLNMFFAKWQGFCLSINALIVKGKFQSSTEMRGEYSTSPELLVIQQHQIGLGKEDGAKWGQQY